MQEPQLSVLMCVYNGERYVREAADSILAQTFDDFEFIIVNDGSTDGTREILESYTDPRIRLINQENMGPGQYRASNQGLRIARAPLVARMDADDVSMPERLEREMEVLERQDDVAVAATGTRTIGLAESAESIPEFTDADLPAQLLEDNLFAHGSTIFRRAAFDAVGGYDEDFPYAGDRYLWLRLAWSGHRFAAVEEPLYHYRVHEQSATSRVRPVQRNYGLEASLRIMRRFRREPDRYAWVDRDALRAALESVACDWRLIRPDGARAAARTLMKVEGCSGLGAKLYVAALPGLAAVRKLMGADGEIKGTESE